MSTHSGLGAPARPGETNPPAPHLSTRLTVCDGAGVDADAVVLDEDFHALADPSRRSIVVASAAARRR
jgi:hypothetical protein